MIIRFVIYGLCGWCGEIVYTALVQFRRERDWRLEGTTYLWMFFVYGLLAPLYEPTHDAIRSWPLLGRAMVWALGFTLVELVTGWLIERLTGRCPWDYVAAGQRFAVNPYIRWDFLPLWALLGLALEPATDFLIELTPAIRDAL